jgi:hypothetical protein
MATPFSLEHRHAGLRRTASQQPESGSAHGGELGVSFGGIAGVRTEKNYIRSGG